MSSDEPIRYSGVSEIALEVIDLEASERFYAEALGLPVVERWTKDHPAPGEAVWLMAGDRTRIGLWTPMLAYANGQGGVHVHFALHLPDEDFDRAVERIRSHGHEVEIFDQSTYGNGRGRAAYVRDPAGHVVELWPWNVGEHLEELARGESPGSG